MRTKETNKTKNMEKNQQIEEKKISVMDLVSDPDKTKARRFSQTEDNNMVNDECCFTVVGGNNDLEKFSEN